MRTTSSRGWFLPFVILFCIAVLAVALITARFYSRSQPPIDEAMLLTLHEFQHARQLTKDDVVELLGPPTSSEPLQPGMAECCHWEVEYQRLVGVNKYRLTLSFNSDDKRVIAHGFFKNGKSFHPELK